MKMPGLCWMAVVLAFILSTGNSLAAVDQNDLAKLVQQIKTEYPVSGMFSLAVSIQSEDPQNLEQLFEDNPKQSVLNTVNGGAVYKGQRLAVATVQKPEHAELRVLKDLKLVNEKGDLLVIYSYASSCATTCTVIGGDYNIITKIRDVINAGNWGKYAFVFEKVFKPNRGPKIEEHILINALKNLATSGIPLANIFRCYTPVNSAFQCTSCSRDGEVEKQCVDYDA